MVHCGSAAPGGLMEEQKGRVETLLVIKTPPPHLLPCHGVQQTFPWGLALARAPLVCQPAWTEAQPPGGGAGGAPHPPFSTLCHRW